MKTVFLLIIISTISLISIAQNQIGTSFAYGIPYYNIKKGDGQIKNITYEPHNAFDLEINYKRRWPGIINFGSSISYQKQSISVEESAENKGVVINTVKDLKVDQLYIKAFPEFIFGDKIRFYAQLGPQLAIRLSSEINGYTDISEGGNTIHNVLTGTAKNEFNKFSFGIVSGIGVDFPLSENWSLSISSQFQYSINSWFQSYDTSYSDRSVFIKVGCNYIIKDVI